MTPEILSAFRSILIAIGSIFVTKGYVDTAALEAIAGGLLAVAAAAWGIYSKRPTSTEARKTAGKVEAHPTAEPIAPSKGVTP